LQPVSIVSLIIVTSPVFANTLPQVIVTPPPIVILVPARTFPTNVDPSSVAEPIGATQYTPTFEPVLFSSTTFEPTAAVSKLSLPNRKMKSTLLRPSALRVSVPFRRKLDGLE
jgi:hypothetical protein